MLEFGAMLIPGCDLENCIKLLFLDLSILPLFCYWDKKNDGIDPLSAVLKSGRANAEWGLLPKG